MRTAVAIPALTAPMTVARAAHIATPLPNGSVLLAGGYDAAIAPTAGAWLYLPAS